MSCPPIIDGYLIDLWNIVNWFSFWTTWVLSVSCWYCFFINNGCSRDYIVLFTHCSCDIKAVTVHWKALCTSRIVHLPEGLCSNNCQKLYVTLKTSSDYLVLLVGFGGRGNGLAGWCLQPKELFSAPAFCRHNLCPFRARHVRLINKSQPANGFFHCLPSVFRFIHIQPEYPISETVFMVKK